MHDATPQLATLVQQVAHPPLAPDALPPMLHPFHHHSACPPLQGFYSVHSVPIIENTARECELTDRLREAVQAYPQANAVLVRRHGVYVWGKNWIEAKTQVWWLVTHMPAQLQLAVAFCCCGMQACMQQLIEPGACPPSRLLPARLPACSLSATSTCLRLL